MKLLNLGLLSLVLAFTACQRKDSSESLTKIRGKGGGANKPSPESSRDKSLTPEESKVVDEVKESNRMTRIKLQVDEMSSIYGQLLKILRNDESSVVDSTPLMLISRHTYDLIEGRDVIVKKEQVNSQNKPAKSNKNKRLSKAERKSQQEKDKAQSELQNKIKSQDLTLMENKEVNEPKFKLVIPKNENAEVSLYYGISDETKEEQKVASWVVRQNIIQFNFSPSSEALKSIVQAASKHSVLSNSECKITMGSDTDGKIKTASCNVLGFVLSDNSYIQTDVFKYTQPESDSDQVIDMKGKVYDATNAEEKSLEAIIGKGIKITETELHDGEVAALTPPTAKPKDVEKAKKEDNKENPAQQPASQSEHISTPPTQAEELYDNPKAVDRVESESGNKSSAEVQSDSSDDDSKNMKDYPRDEEISGASESDYTDDAYKKWSEEAEAAATKKQKDREDAEKAPKFLRRVITD